MDEHGRRHATRQGRLPRPAAVRPTHGTAGTGRHLAGVAAEVSYSNADSSHPYLTHAERRQMDDAMTKGDSTRGREDPTTYTRRQVKLFTRFAGTVSTSRSHDITSQRTPASELSECVES